MDAFDAQELARFEEAASAVIHGAATEEQVRFLEGCFKKDAQYVRLYKEQVDTYVTLDYLLRDAGGRAARGRVPFAGRLFRFARAAAAAAVLSGMMAGMGYALARMQVTCATCKGRAALDRALADTRPVAFVRGSYYGVREDGTSIARGDALEKGTWSWQNGLVEVEMVSGTALIVQAPAVMEVYDSRHIRLYQGRMVVTMPKGESGFRVDTHEMNVVDLGTQFGVGVNPLGESRVQVFEGSVSVTSTVCPDQRILPEGGTLRVTPDGRLRPTKLSDTAFARRLPEAKPDSQIVGNTPEYQSMEVAYAEHPIRIDGNLDEWKDIPAFRAACRPPFNRTHTVEGRLAYDESNLYISANIGDPYPLVNQRRDELQQDRVTGGLVVHFASGKKADADGFGLVLWYDSERGQPGLMIETRDDEGNTVRRRAEAWDGAFRKHANGYILEYRIPWAAVGMAAAPQAQDELLNCWDVHWYDAEGRVMTARLIENVNAAPGRYLAGIGGGPAWGTVVFRPRK